MKLLIFFAIVAAINAVPIPDYDDGQYHEDPNEDNGQYHEDHSGDYHPENSGSYHESNFDYDNGGSKVEPYKHIRYEDHSGDYHPENSGSYHENAKGSAYFGQNEANYNNFNREKNVNQYSSQIGTSNNGQYSKSSGDDGQYHQDQNEQSGKYTGFTNSQVTSGNVGQKTTVAQLSGLSALSHQNVFGHNVVDTPSHKAVNQEDDGQYHPEQDSQGAGRSTYSYSGTTGHILAPGNVGYKTPVAQHSGSSNSAVGHQNVFGHNVVGTASHKAVNQEDDGQYHPEPVGQGAGRSTYSYSGTTGYNVAPGNVGYKTPVAQHSGSSNSAVGHQNVFGHNVVGTSSHNAVNQEDDGQYHPEPVDQGAGRSTYLHSGTTGHNAAPENVGYKTPVAQHSGSSMSAVGDQNVFGHNVVGTYSHKAVNQEDDGQYHPEPVGQGAGRSTYSQSGTTGHNVAPGNVGYKTPVAQHSGSSNSAVGHQNVFGHNVVGTSYHKAVNNQEDDGQYHPEPVGQGAGRSTYSHSGTTGHIVAPGNVGYKTPVAQHSGSSISAVGDQNVFGHNVVGTSSHKAVNQEDDGQYHPEPVGQGAGRSTYLHSGTTGHIVAPGNVGYKTPVAQHSGSSNSAVGHQNVFGHNMVGTFSHKAVNQEDDGQYHPEQVSQGAGRSTHSYSGSTGHNVAPGNVGHKLPVAQHTSPSNSAVSNQNVFGQNVVGTSSHKFVNHEDDGQYHSEQVGQGAGRSTYSYSGTTGHNVAPGNVGHKLTVAQHTGPSNSAVGHQNVFGHNVVGTSSHKAVNHEDDGQYHSEQVGQGAGRSTYSYSGTTGHNVAPGNVGPKLPFAQHTGPSNSVVGHQNVFGHNAVSTSSHKAVNQEDDGQYHPEQVSQGEGRSTYSYSGTTGHNVAPGNVGPKLPFAQHTGPSNSVVGHQSVFGQNVVGTSSHKAVSQEDDGQYHPEQVSQGAGRSTYSYSGTTGHNVAPGNVGHKLPVAQHSGSSNFAVSNQNSVGQNVASTSSHKSVNQEDDGQYHPEQVSQGTGRSTYSFSGSTSHNVAPGNVGHKLPVAQHTGPSNSAVRNQNVFGQKVVSTSSHKADNKEDDGQYHSEQVSQGTGRSTYSSSGSTSHNVAPGNVGYKSNVGQHTGPSSSAVGNQNVFGQKVVSTSSHKADNKEDEGQYHSEQVSQGTGRSTYSSSGSTGHNVAPGNVGHKLPIAQHTGPSNSAVINQNVFLQKVVSTSSHKADNKEDDGQYHSEQVSQGTGRSTYSSSGSTSHNVAPGNVGYKSNVGQHTGPSSSAVGNQNVFGQKVVSTSSHKADNKEDDGQYHSEQVSQGTGRSTYSSSGSTGHNVATGNVGHKLPIAQHTGPSNSAVINQNVFGQKVVSTSSHKADNKEDDGQYHSEQVSQGTGRSTYSSSGSASHNVAPGNVGHKLNVGQHTGPSNSAVSNQNVFGQKVVSTSLHKADNKEDDGQYHSEQVSQGTGRSTYSSSGSTSHNVAPGNVGHKLPVAQHTGPSNSAVSNQNVFGQKVVSTSLHKADNKENDGQYHSEQVSQGTGRSTYSSSGSTSHNVAPGNVGHKLPVAQHTGPSNSAVSNQNVFGQNVASTSSHKAVNQEDDGQYHPEQVSQGTGRSTYSSSGSTSHNVAPENVGHKLLVAQHTGPSNSVVSNQNVFGQNVASTSSHKAVNQEDDGQYHPEQVSQGTGRSAYSSSGSTSHNVAPGNVGHKLPVAQHTGPSNSAVSNQNVFGQKVVSTSSHKADNKEDDGQYHSEQVSQGAGRSTYSFSGSTSHNVAPGNVGHKLPVGQHTGPSNSAGSYQNTFGQNVVSTSSHKAVNQVDDEQYHPEQVSQGAGRSTYSYSGTTGHNVAPGNVGHKLPVAQHTVPSTSAVSNQNVFGQKVVSTSSHKGDNQEDDGQYHPEQVSQGTGKSTHSFSGFTSHNVASGNVGHKLPVAQHSGSSNSAASNQNAFGTNVVSTSSHKAVNQEDDGKYHPEQVSQGAGRSTYSYSGSTDYNVAPVNVGQKTDEYSSYKSFFAKHSGSSNPGVNIQNSLGQQVVSTSNQEDDGQYHSEQNNQVSQNSGRSYSFSGNTVNNAATGNVGHKTEEFFSYKSPVTQHNNQNGFGQKLVSFSSYKSVNDGQYHPDSSEVGQVAGKSNLLFNNLASRFSDSSNADSQNVAGVSNNNLISTSGYKQDRTVVSEYAKPSGGAHFQHSNQEVFELAQPRLHVEPLGKNEMKQVHKTLQSSVFKHGQQNGNTNAGQIGSIKKTEEFTDDGYHYIYETENGIFAEEEGHLVEKGTKNVHLKVKGFYSYTGPVVYTVEYTADSISGFVPKFSNVEKSERLSKSAKFQLQK